MRLIIFCLCLIGLNLLNAQDCNCGDTKGTNHLRFDVKNRAPRAKTATNGAPNEITIEKILDWPVPTKYFERKPANNYTHEDELYTLTGYVQRFRISDQNCDILLELSEDPSPGSSRIIAAIPNTQAYCAMRKDFVNALKEFFGRNLKDDEDFRGSDVPQVRLTGLPFFNTGHWRKKTVEDVKGVNHGSKKVATLWEIHPVTEIAIEY